MNNQLKLMRTDDNRNGFGHSCKAVMLFLVLVFLALTEANAQTPVIKVRFNNPVYNCASQNYCVDVEFQSNLESKQLFGMNVRFFYDDSKLEFLSFNSFQGGYSAVSPNPPVITTGDPTSGPVLFTLTGAAEFVNGAIQLTNAAATPIYISTSGWTKLFSMCFHVDDPAAINIPEFCPSLIWDLQENPANGGMSGSDGVVMTVVAPPPTDSSPATENVLQYNWQYDGITGFPYGFPVKSVCVSTLLPNANAGPDKKLTCQSQSLTLEGSSTTSGVTYSWVASNGGNIVSGANTATPVVNAVGTYTLTVTQTSTGCSNTDVALVTTDVVLPNANAGEDKTLTCLITSVTLSGSSSTAGATFSWVASNGGNIVSGAGTATPVVNAAGTYTLTVTGPNGCTNTDVALVTLTTVPPDVNAGPDKQLTCTTTSVTLSGSSTTPGATFSWSASNGGNIVSGANSATPTVNATGTYTLTVTNPANGCKAIDAALVTLSADVPVANAGPDKKLNCTVSSVTLSGSSATPGVSYSWTASNGGNIVSGSNTATPLVNAAGTYTLRVTAPNGCSSDDAAIVELDNTPPQANAGPDKQLTCTSLTVTLSGSSSTAGAIYSWVASGGGHIVSGANTLTPVVNASGTYTLTVTAPNTCTATDFAVVTSDVNIPDANAGPDKVLTCSTTSVTLSGYSATPGVTYSWVASNGGNIVSGATTATPVVNAAGTYTLTVTSASSCKAEDIAIVTLDRVAPNANAGPDKALTCTVSSVTLSGSSTTPGVSYAWVATNGGRIVSGASTATPVVDAPGTYTLTVTATNGCSSTDVALVTNDATLPNVNAGPDKSITCTVKSLNLSGSSATTGVTYAWVASNGGNIVSGANTATPLVDAVGTYTLTVTAPNGCQATDVALVTLNTTPPNANAGPDKSITCAASTVSLSGSSATAGVTFSWVASGGGQIVSGANSATPVVNAAGNYTLTVTNPVNGCTATDVALVTSSADVPNVSAGEDKILTCTTNSVTLIGTSTTAGVTYSWIASGGGRIVSGANTATPVADAAGTYTLTVTAPNGCSNSDVALVTLSQAAPSVNAGPDKVISCVSTTVTLSGSSTTPGVSYAWVASNGGRIVSGANTASPVVDAAGTYRLTVTDPANGCSASDNALVTADASLPNGTAGQDKVLTCAVTSLSLSASSTTAGVTYSWTAGNGGHIISGANTATPLVDEPGTYTVTITAPNGCYITDAATVTRDTRILTDLSVVKTTQNAYPQLADNVPFVITASNLGPCPATGVKVTDVLPAGYVFVSAVPTRGTWSGSTWTIGDLASGGSEKLTLTATAAVTGAVTNTAVITGAETDLVAGNNSSSVLVQAGTGADMAITKNISVLAAYVGTEVSFTITVRNNGPVRATNIVMTDLLPAGFTLVSATVSAGEWNAPNWNIITLNSGNSAKMTMVVRVNAQGPYKNTATVKATQEDFNLSNNTASAQLSTIYTEFTAINEHIGMCNQISVSGNILANGDKDPAGESIQVNTTPVSGPSHGSFILQSNGDFTYIPEAGFAGKDMVVTKICVKSYCAMDTLFFYVNVGLEADAGKDQDICRMASARLTGNSLQFAAVSWSQISGPSTAEITSPSSPETNISGLITGTYQFRYRITLAECEDDDTVRITAWDPPVANAGPDAVICSSNEFKVRFASASGYASLKWSHNGTGTLTGMNTLTPGYKSGENEVGQVKLILTAKAKGSEGCAEAVDELVLTILPQPQIICPQPDTYTFQVTPGYCGYLVSNNQLDATGDKSCCPDLVMNHDLYTAANMSTLRGAVLPIGTTIIKWWANAYSESCSSDTCYIKVTVKDPVSPEFISCPEGKEFTVGLTGSNCEGGATWNIPVAVDNCPGVNVKQIKGPELGSTLKTGRYNVVYVAYDLSGNTDTCSFFLNVIDSETPLLICPPSLTVGTDPGLCAWKAPAFSLSPLLAQSNCPFTLTWEVTNPDGTVKQGEKDVSGYLFPTGKSVVKYRLKENASSQTVECTFTVTVTDKEPPVVFCPGTLAYETVNGKCDYEIELKLPGYADACNSPVRITYTVINPDNSVRGPYQSNALKYLFLAGTSRVVWSLTDGSGNKAECIQEVKITVSNKDIIPFAGNDTTICEGSPLVLSQSKVSPYAKVLWTTSGSGTFKEPDGIHPTYVPGVLDILNGKVLLTMKAYTECAIAYDYMVLNITSRPKINAGTDFSVCAGEEIIISKAEAENVNSVKWITNGKGTLTATNFLQTSYKPAPGESGVIRFVLSAKGKEGCSGTELTDTLKVTIYEPLFVKAGNDISILTNYSTVLTANASNGSGFYYYSWQPPDLVQSVNNNVTETRPLTASTSFIVTVTDDRRNCTAKDTVNVTVKDNIDDILVIYNAISPNGDKLNDVWWIDGIELFPENSVMIFNRWGDKITEMAGYDNNRVYWDGTNSKGKRVPDGTYYYLLKIKNIKTYTGWIQVKSSL